MNLVSRRILRLAISMLSGFVLLQPVSALAQSMTVNCQKNPESSRQRCQLDIYDSVLQGINGSQVRVRFPDNYSAEAFCVDPESDNCLVRSQGSNWEEGRIRWVQTYPGFRAAFFIETNNGRVIGIYDAPFSY